MATLTLIFFRPQCFVNLFYLQYLMFHYEYNQSFKLVSYENMKYLKFEI